MKKKVFLGYGLYAISLLLLITPTVIWFYWNRDAYFADKTVNLSIGAILTLLSVVLLLKGGLKDLDRRFKPIFWITMGIVITYFMQSIIADLMWILVCALVGYVFYAILSTIAMYNIKYVRTYVNERARIEARSDYSAGNV